MWRGTVGDGGGVVCVEGVSKNMVVCSLCLFDNRGVFIGN